MATKSWTSLVSGLWATDADWTPSGAPGASDAVTVTGPAAAYQILTGPGNAASLTFLGDTVLNGIFIDSGAVALGATNTAGGLDLAPGTVLVTTGVTFVGGNLAAYGSGTGLADKGGLAFNGTNSYNSIAAYDGAVVQAGSILGTANYTISADAQSAVEIGSASDATFGEITVDAGQTVGGSGSLTASNGIVNNGTIVAAGTAFSLFGPVTGSGTMQIGAGGTLTLDGGVST